MGETSWQPVLAFDTDDPEFARGVECGALWADLQANPDEEVVQTIHGTNAEMVLRMGEVLGRRVDAELCDGDGYWMEARFFPVGDVDD